MWYHVWIFSTAHLGTYVIIPCFFCASTRMETYTMGPWLVFSFRRLKLNCLQPSGGLQDPPRLHRWNRLHLPRNPRRIMERTSTVPVFIWNGLLSRHLFLVLQQYPLHVGTQPVEYVCCRVALIIFIDSPQQWLWRTPKSLRMPQLLLLGVEMVVVDLQRRLGIPFRYLFACRCNTSKNLMCMHLL